MKISLVVVGKTRSKDVAAIVADYTKRLAHYTTFEFIEVVDGARLAKALERFDRIILLDERGTEHASVEFSRFIEKQMNASVKNIAFVVGGPFGFDGEVRAMSHGSIALSKMTFPHDLVRAVFLEQLYRAFTILRNEKYHHA